MVCKVCGKALSDTASFCGGCGTSILSSETEIEEIPKGAYVCENCGEALAPEEDVCPACGTAVPTLEGAEEEETPKSKTRSFAIAIFLFGTIVLAGLIGYLMFSHVLPGFSKEKPRTTGETELPASAQPATATPASAPTSNIPQTNLREDAYDSTLYYSRMNEMIHKSTPVDDRTFLELEAEIQNFNNECADYMNGVSEEPPKQLKPGSDAYKSQTSHKQKNPNLRQYYESVYVINGRSDGQNYFVWAEETIRSFNNGEDNKETHHWVYRLQNENGQWYIIDFTKDPRYK